MNQSLSISFTAKTVLSFILVSFKEMYGKRTHSGKNARMSPFSYHFPLNNYGES